MAFKVLFFDGKSSKTHKATITPSAIRWKISYFNEFGIPVEIFWTLSKTKKTAVYTKGLVSFTYGDTFPFQKIESSDAAFISYINNVDSPNLRNKIDLVLHKSIKRTIPFLILTMIGIGFAMYFYVLPTVATGFASNLNKKSVVGFGNYVFKVVALDLEINPEKSKKLQDFVDAMKMNNTFPVKIYVAESNQKNAFAISGGKIVLLSALLEKIEDESQLAALIGHELSHIENRHVIKNVARNISGAIFISILFGDINAVTTVLADNAHLFSQLSYTRSLEKEADLFGLNILRENGLDLNGMPALFQILKNESKIQMPSYLNSHPMLEDRIQYTKRIAKTQKEISENTQLKKKWEILKKTFPKTDSIVSLKNE